MFQATITIWLSDDGLYRPKHVAIFK